MVDLIEMVKKKRDFAGLPDSVVERALEITKEDLLDEERVKEARANLRKYYGVFLTNRVVKPKDIMDYDSVLLSHKSSLKRNYKEFYSKIFEDLIEGKVWSVVDLGCGVNGFSYPYLEKVFGRVRYVGVEASSQLVNNTNRFFEFSGYGKECEVVQGDLFDIHFSENILKSESEAKGSGKKARVVFLFQVIDALEGTRKNFSKEILSMLKKNCEYIVISMPCVSLSGKNLKAKRSWVFEFLKEEFEVVSEFEANGEKVFCLKC